MPLFYFFLKTEVLLFLFHILSIFSATQPSPPPFPLSYHLIASIFSHSDSGRASQQDPPQFLPLLPSSR